MSQVAERKRPDPYADENTIVRRKRGVTIGAYQGLTIAVLACLVGALFFLGVDTVAQKAVSIVALIVAAAFLATMARRQSRSEEADRTQVIGAGWSVGLEGVGSGCWWSARGGAVRLAGRVGVSWSLGHYHARGVAATAA